MSKGKWGKRGTKRGKLITNREGKTILVDDNHHKLCQVCYRNIKHCHCPKSCPLCELSLPHSNHKTRQELWGW